MSVAWHAQQQYHHQPQHYQQQQYMMPQSYVEQQHYVTQQACMVPMTVQRPVVVQQRMMVQQPMMVRRVVRQPFVVQHQVQRVQPVHKHVRYWLPAERPDYSHYSESDDYEHSEYGERDECRKRRERSSSSSHTRRIIRRQPPPMPAPAMGASTAVRVAGGYKVYNTEGGEASSDLHVGKFRDEFPEGHIGSHTTSTSRIETAHSGHRGSGGHRDRPVRKAEIGDEYDDDECVPSRESRFQRRSGLPSGKDMRNDFQSRSMTSRGSSSSFASRSGLSRSSSDLLDNVKFERMSTENLASLIGQAARSLASR